MNSASLQRYINAGLSLEWSDFLLLWEFRVGTLDKPLFMLFHAYSRIETADVTSFAQDCLAFDDTEECCELACAEPSTHGQDILVLLKNLVGTDYDFGRAYNRGGIAALHYLYEVFKEEGSTYFDDYGCELIDFWSFFGEHCYWAKGLPEVEFWSYGAFDWQGWLDITKQWLGVAIQKFGDSSESNL